MLAAGADEASCIIAISTARQMPGARLSYEYRVAEFCQRAYDIGADGTSKK